MFPFGDIEKGQEVNWDFVTRDGKVLTPQFEKVGGGGLPVLGMRRMSSRAELLQGAAEDDLFSSVTINSKPGVHAVKLDTNSDFIAEFDDYELFVADGQVIDGGVATPVSQEPLMSFSVINRTAGHVLDRSHKIVNGVVSRAIDASRFEVTGLDINTVDPDYYLGMAVSFQRASQNQQLDRTCVSFTPSTGLMIVDAPFSRVPQAGDEFDMLFGRGLPYYTANIVFDAGKGNRPDAIGWTWHREAENIDPSMMAAEIPVMSLQCWSVTYPADTAAVTNLVQTIVDQPVDTDTGSFQFVLANPPHFSLTGNALKMKGEATLVSTGRKISFSRQMFVL